jgi:hypothetical protein
MTPTSGLALTALVVLIELFGADIAGAPVDLVEEGLLGSTYRLAETNGAFEISNGEGRLLARVERSAVQARIFTLLPIDTNEPQIVDLRSIAAELADPDLEPNQTFSVPRGPLQGEWNLEARGDICYFWSSAHSLLFVIR